MKSRLVLTLAIPFLCFWSTSASKAHDDPSHHSLNGNKVLILNGGHAQVAIADSSSLKLEGEVTLEAWVYPMKVEGLCQIVAKGDFAGGQDPYYLRLFPDGEKIAVNFGFWQPDIMGFGVASWVDSQRLMNQWNHIAATVDFEKDDDSTVSLYLNGEKLTTWWQNSGLRTGSDREMPINIGAIHASQTFAGLIDEVRIWRVARTQDEIRSTMNGPLNDHEENLVGYWNFDDGTAKDLSPHGNHGTLVGDATIVRWDRK